MRLKVKVSFLGGATDIGASSALLEISGKSFLIDCGVRFDPARPLPNLDELGGRHLDAILVTHAHSDHTGGLPVVHDSFPGVPIHMTPPTLDLITILYRDALKIMASDERENEIPLYGEEQVLRMLDMVRTVPLEGTLSFDDVTVTWLPASHILGAAMLHFSSPEGSVLFTGDYSVSPQLTVPGLKRTLLPVDMLITETTYGNRLHADREAGERKLVERIAEVVDRKGRILIPAFAIGRAQEVLLILKRAMQEHLIPEVPVFVDGMVRAVCGVYSRHERYVSRHLLHEIRTAGHPFFNENIRAVGSPKDREKVLHTSPCIIVSSSGMLNGGPSAYYARQLLVNKNDAIFITGYQDEESPGRALLNLAGKKTDRFIRIGGEKIAVESEFDTYSLSAHADRLQMAGLVSALAPKTLVLVHGDADAKSGLMQAVGCQDIVAAENGSVVSRRYEKRKPSIRTKVPAVTEEDARRLVQSLQQKTIEESRLIEGLTGSIMSGESLAAVTRKLIDWGLVTRDDERRHILHIEIVSVESDEQKRLQKENPKGRLLEACMQAGTGMPKFSTIKKGFDCQCTASASALGQIFESGLMIARDDKLAEQMAADAILNAIDAHFQTAVQLVDVRSDEEQIGNAKGRFLERGTPPRMELLFLPMRAGIAASATVKGDSTPFFLASSKKAAEQAVYHHMLGGGGENQPKKVESALAVAGSGNPKGQLNELKQKRQIDDYGFEVRTQGPPHQPVFSGRGWLQVDGKKVQTPLLETLSRKAFEHAAASILLEMKAAPAADFPLI
jgi:Cft2 family RNA processing exonuclease